MSEGYKTITAVENVEFFLSHYCSELSINQTTTITINDIVESGVPICTSCDEEYELEGSCGIK